MSVCWTKSRLRALCCPCIVTPPAQRDGTGFSVCRRWALPWPFPSGTGAGVTNSPWPTTTEQLVLGWSGGPSETQPVENSGDCYEEATGVCLGICEHQGVPTGTGLETARMWSSRTEVSAFVPEPGVCSQPWVPIGVLLNVPMLNTLVTKLTEYSRGHQDLT